MTPGPAVFNACDYLLDRHVRAGRGDRLALTGAAGDLSYGACPRPRPRRIVFVTEYPTTSTGKIRRVELRAQADVIMQGEPEPPPAPVVPL